MDNKNMAKKSYLFDNVWNCTVVIWYCQLRDSQVIKSSYKGWSYMFFTQKKEKKNVQNICTGHHTMQFHLYIVRLLLPVTLHVTSMVTAFNTFTHSFSFFLLPAFKSTCRKASRGQSASDKLQKA